MAQPLLEEWTRLIGEASEDYASSISSTSDGYIYLVGHTDSDLDGKINSGNEDAYIVKYNAYGYKLWTNLIGGAGSDTARSVSSSSGGSIYTVGFTENNLDAQINSGGFDTFITKFNPDGSKSWTKLIGGSGQDYGWSSSITNDQSIYIVGDTDSNLDGQANRGEADAFITKFNPDGSKLWTKLIGGASTDGAHSVSTASDGSIYIVGYTFSNLEGQKNGGGSDAFLAKFNSNGSMAWLKLNGGPAEEYGWSVSTAYDGSIYMVGTTDGNIDGQTSNGESDAFITKFNSDGSKAWTKLIGGTSGDYGLSSSTTSDGSVYLAGYTDGNIDGQINNSENNDIFITKFSSNGTKEWTKLLGYTSSDYASSIANGSDGSIYVAGDTDNDLGMQTNSGGSDAFIIKMSIVGATNNVDSGQVYYNPVSANMLGAWNLYRVDNSVTASDIVSQWFGTFASANQQIQDVSELLIMDILASTWQDGVQINRAAKATDAGGKIEAKQINYSSGEVAGSVVSGGTGNDDIKGYAGWDFLDGGAGDDLIHGGNGRDIISGGAGRDELHGDFGWNTYKSERDGVSDLIAVKSDHYLVNWLYGKAGNSPNGEKSDIIEGLDSIDKIKLIGVDTSEITFAANISAKGVTGIGIYGKGILEALYTGGDLTVSQITQMTSGDASAAAMSNSVNAYGVW